MQSKLLSISTITAVIILPISAIAEDLKKITAEAEMAEQPLILTPETEVNTDLVFSGYARYGLRHSNDFKQYVGAEGQLSGNSVGRLGNEENGGEFQLTKAFISDNGAIWDVAVMFEHWGGENADVGLKKAYAGVTNLFETQPSAYIWAGRDFHQRPQDDINDYQWMLHDGQGAGIYNLDLKGVADLDFAVVAEVSPGTGDSGNYAFTSKLHGINIGTAHEFSFLFNYGFESYKHDKDGERTNNNSLASWQLAGVLDTQFSDGTTRLTVRYADNADNSTFWMTEDVTTLYASLEGNFILSNKWATQFLLSYHNYQNDGVVDSTPELGDTRSRSNYSVIARPMYNWNEVHSTWLEAGYSNVDYDNGEGVNDAWKLTLSQNISFGFSGARPMLRFYATVGEANNEASIYSYDKFQDTLALGAMFESWW